MSLILFQQQIENKTKCKLKLKINNNRRTMLRVRWEPGCTLVSMHRMFLGAPQNVMDNLVCYIKREHKALSPTIKMYMEENLRKFDYSHTIRPGQLLTQGSVYNLKKLYNQVNEEYFEGKMDLNITWFGKPKIKSRSKIIYGLYVEPQKLIKIHSLLDNITVPDYVISYVIYHEMLHHVCRTCVDEKGCYRAHTKAFKDREKQFRYFDLALDWMDTYEHAFFGEHRYGRA